MTAVPAPGEGGSGAGGEGPAPAPVTRSSGMRRGQTRPQPEPGALPPADPRVLSLGTVSASSTPTSPLVLSAGDSVGRSPTRPLGSRVPGHRPWRDPLPQDPFASLLSASSLTLFEALCFIK